MRRARITYEGAFHHVMNRGIRGEEIFTGSRCKTQFLDYLKEKSAKLHIRIFTYCIMNSHYHLILENSSGKMSEFLKQVNGEYGMYYRKHAGGKGYVFQNRFKSTLIQDEAYLQTSIAYTLLNPVRAGMVKQPEDYVWSSFNDYFSSRNSGIVDTLFVEELFGSRSEFLHFIQLQSGKEIIERRTRYGCILGSDEFLKEALKKYDRRKRQEGLHGKRINDRYFEPVEKVIWEFERQKGISIEDIQPHTIIGKRLRAELLVHLKDRAGLTYPEIIKFEIFDNLSVGSLASIYQNAKRKMK